MIPKLLVLIVVVVASFRLPAVPGVVVELAALALAAVVILRDPHDVHYRPDLYDQEVDG